MSIHKLCQEITSTLAHTEEKQGLCYGMRSPPICEATACCPLDLYLEDLIFMWWCGLILPCRSNTLDLYPFFKDNNESYYQHRLFFNNFVRLSICKEKVYVSFVVLSINGSVFKYIYNKIYK